MKDKLYRVYTEGDPDLSVYRVRTLPFSVILTKKRELYRDLNFPALPFKNANFSFKRKPYRTNTLTVFRDFNTKNLILMEFIRKARTVPRCVFI